ncbi:MAG: NADPH:quinone oxidoreductase family protein [Sphingomonas bacterium]
MKALLSVTPGGSETLATGDLPEPEATAGKIVVSVHACSINYPDVLIIEDKYQFKPPRPFAPGCEIAGTVSAVGSGVEGFAVGDRVIATTGHGGLAERVAVDAQRVFPLPDGHSFEEGAALLFTYGTTIHALVDRGHVREGDNLLVLGAAGGIGLSAVELGKAFGARVIAAVSSEEKAAAARAAGADDTVIYPRGPLSREESKTLANQFKQLAGPDGFQLVYDPVGGDYAEPAVRAMGWEGRYLVTGFPAGIPHLPLNLTLLKSCDICGVFWGAFAARDPKANRANIQRLMDLWQQRRIAPRVSETFDFADAGAAIRKMAERGAIGKLVVRVGE